MYRRSILISTTFFACLAATLQAQAGTFIDRHSPLDVRILCYNINWDSIFPDDDPDNHAYRSYNMVDEFRRIAAAVSPDIVCLQEINPDRSSQDVADILDEVVPLSGGATWQAHIGSDNVIASRWDLSMLATDTIPSTNRGQAMALVDLPDARFGIDLYLMNIHCKCCGGDENIAKRQKHADAIIHWIGDIKSPGGNINLPIATPIVVLGDLNVYQTDPHYHLTTLITGDIVNEDIYGPDLNPDWDDTHSVDALPLANGVGPEFYTWRSDGSGFEPGALDRIVYTDSAVQAISNSFVLNTVIMTQSERELTGLQENDVLLDPPGYYDHLPIVVDMRFTPVAQPDGDASLDGYTDARDISWFVEQTLAGISADPLRVLHVDYDGNGLADAGDIADFVDDLLGTP